MYWAEALATQDDDPSLKDRFGRFAANLKDNEDTINAELLAAQGDPVDVGNTRPNDDLADKAMRPSATLNAALESLTSG